jgi:hypothetical protein
MPRIVSVGQANQEIQKLSKRLEKFEAFMQDMRKWADLMGFYKGSDGQDMPCIVTRAFPNVGTIEAIVFDGGGSGGILELTNATLGTKRNEVRLILRPDEPEADEAEEESDELVAT